MILTNYINTAWRNIYNHKLFSAINILGLAIGLAACMLIALFVRDELSYDKNWANADNIYRMHQTFLPTARPPMEFAAAAGPIQHVLQKDFPQMEYAARMAHKRITIIQDNNYFEEQVSLVDQDLIKIFDFNQVSGNLNSSLQNQNSLILNQSLANKYFPEEDPIGKTLTLNLDVVEREYVVNGVIEDIPENSVLNIQAMVPIVEEDWKIFEWQFDSWFSVNSQQFFTLLPGSDIADVNSRMPTFIDRNFPRDEGGDAVSSFVELSSMKLTDLHLLAPGNSGGSMATVLTFSAVATLILIIASINFMNLSTARASQRAKEVSLRKVVGASRKHLVTQFIGESILITLFALFVSLVIIELSLPVYNEIIGKNLSLDYGSNDILYVVGLAVFVGGIGGIYPAFILSSFRPAEVLKANQSSETGSSVKLRAALVIFQFAVSISLFVSTAVVYGQMLYAKNIELGFEKDNLLVINNVFRDAADDKLALLLEEYRRIPNALNVTWSNDAPGVPTENNTSLRTPDKPKNESQLMGNRGIGYDYFETYQIPMLAGRSYDINMNDERATYENIVAGRGHTSSLIVNETALRKFGLGTPEEAIGKLLYRPLSGDGGDVERVHQIIGVIPDVHLDTLKKEIRPEIFELRPEHAQYITIRFSGDPIAMVEQVQAIWEQEVPSVPFSYDFAEENLTEQYAKEQGEMTMFAAFSGLAIFIACLGLYGLASFTAERRTKEIGVRKVMGATVYDIVKLLVWQFSKPVLIANLVAWPVSFYAMSLWLQSFVYRIEEILIFGFCAFAGVAALLIAWATVAGNSMRVAKSNPIKALRYE